MKAVLGLVSFAILLCAPAAFASINGSCVTFLQDHGDSGAEAQYDCRGIKTAKQLACMKALVLNVGEAWSDECLNPPAKAKAVASKKKPKTKSRRRRGDDSDGESYGYAYSYSGRSSGSDDDSGSHNSQTVIVLHSDGSAPSVGIDTGGVVIPTNGGLPFPTIGAGSGTVIQP